MVILRQGIESNAVRHGGACSWNPADEVDDASAVLLSPMRPVDGRGAAGFPSGCRRGPVLPDCSSCWSRQGCVRGEVLGLRWADVDVDGGRLAVRHTIGRVGGKVVEGEPKTAKSKRSIALDPQTVAVLRRQRVAQLEERLAWGGLYRDQDLVFAREDGSADQPGVCGAGAAAHRRRRRVSRPSTDPRSPPRLGDGGPRGGRAPEGGERQELGHSQGVGHPRRVLACRPGGGRRGGPDRSHLSCSAGAAVTRRGSL